MLQAERWRRKNKWVESWILQGQPQGFFPFFLHFSFCVLFGLPEQPSGAIRLTDEPLPILHSGHKASYMDCPVPVVQDTTRHA